MLGFAKSHLCGELRDSDTTLKKKRKKKKGWNKLSVCIGLTTS